MEGHDDGIPRCCREPRPQSLERELGPADDVVLPRARHLHEEHGESRDAHDQVLVLLGMVLGGMQRSDTSNQSFLKNGQSVQSSVSLFQFAIGFEKRSIIIWSKKLFNLIMRRNFLIRIN